MDAKTLVIKPRISEKAYGQSMTTRTYVIDVPTNANKDLVVKAMAAQFNVTVTSVNIVVAKGKTKRTVRKGGRPTMGKRSDIKKAYITLQEGDSLPFFEQIEEAAEADAKKSDKKEKETK
ncbi:MAG TPA: 50S ribosomal protein L23 [Candidatus Saccharimonadales bacterium]|nr:50S ribosomal protein L23 [Candidatus Saccharimonadales bacterium]